LVETEDVVVMKPSVQVLNTPEYFCSRQYLLLHACLHPTFYTCQDLDTLDRTMEEPGGSVEEVVLKLEFVTKVCSPPRTLDPQLHSWVALFCQQAAEVLGEDFAVGRVTKPAVVEVARCV
jgi:hypothetical protein